MHANSCIYLSFFFSTHTPESVSPAPPALTFFFQQNPPFVGEVILDGALLKTKELHRGGG
jgi:hypothetical protein